jgi:hypothetical protein
MNLEKDVAKQLQDLLFELVAGGRAKFLIALCDGVRLRRRLQSEIDTELAKTGRHATRVSVSTVSENLFRVLVNQSRRKTVNAIHLLDFEKLPPAKQHRVFAELNFHRDALGTLGFPILIWLSPKLLPRMISDAPDLWSRRGAVYHFSQTTAKSFLKILFRQSPSESKQWKPEPTLSEAFKKIFATERALDQCLKDRNSFSLTKADGLIAKIHAGVDSLVTECKRGRQIEVALWLWNLSHLDAELQEILDSLEPNQRIRYESLYTDRNEALLYLSKKLPDILRKYRDSLAVNIKSKKRISLLRRSKELAMSQLARMARELSSPAQMPLSFDTGAESYFGGVYPWTQSPDTVFLEKAARDLEEWLAGVVKTGPTFLSKEEGELLKLLYANPGSPRIVARLAKMPVAEVKQKLKALQRKVSLYLGVAPTSHDRRHAKAGLAD